MLKKYNGNILFSASIHLHDYLLYFGSTIILYILFGDKYFIYILYDKYFILFLFIFIWFTWWANKRIKKYTHADRFNLSNSVVENVEEKKMLIYY